MPKLSFITVGSEGLYSICPDQVVSLKYGTSVVRSNVAKSGTERQKKKLKNGFEIEYKNTVNTMKSVTVYNGIVS